MPVAQFSGIASGIDSAALIDAIIEARSVTNEIRRQEVTSLEAENDALEELNTRLIALNDLIDPFRTANGGGVSKKTSSTDASVVTASAANGAINASYNLTVNAVADIATASFDDVYTSLDDPLAPNAVGTQTIGVDIGASSPLSIDVDITNTTTISSFVDSFNQNANAQGNVSASIVNVGTEASPSYRVLFTTQQSGLDDGQIAFDIPTDVAGFGGNPDLQNRTIDQATDANFDLSGVGSSITRSSNIVSDVVGNVTFNLQATGSATVSVSTDADTTSDRAKEIIEAFDDIVTYINENDLVQSVDNGEETENIFGSLAKTRVDDDFLSAFRLEISSAGSTNGTSVFSFADMGVSTNRDGTISFDEDQFLEAVSNDALGVAEVLTDFADSTSGINGMINQYTRLNGFVDLAQDGNTNEIQLLNDEIDQLDRFNENLRDALTKRYALLEGRIGDLQGQQSQLSGILAGLG